MEPLPDDLVELELPDDLQDIGAPEAPQNMSVGNPATINVPPEEPGLASQALTFAQDYSKAHLRGVLGVPAADARDSYFNSISNAVPIHKVIPDSLKVPAARALQGANPLISGEAGEKVFETPEGQKAGLDFQRGVEDSVGARAVGAVFGQQARLNAADAMGGAIQGAASVLPSAIPVVGGMNLSGQLAAKLAPRFPMLAGFIGGALETGGQMLVTGTLGAEEGQRLATLEALLAPPQTKEEWLLKVGLPLAGGMGASIGARHLVTAQARAKVNQAAKVGTADAYTTALELSHDVAESRAQYRTQVAAIINKDHVRAIADDMEMKAAVAKGEMLSVAPDKKSPVAIVQQAAIVAAPDAKKGVAVVTEMSDGTVEVQNIDNVTDATKAQTVLSKRMKGRKGEMAVSSKAQDILSKEPDSDLKDALILTPQERAEGKTADSIGSRDAALVWDHGAADEAAELPYLAKLSDPAVKAEAISRAGGIALIRTKDGPSFVRIIGDADSSTFIAQKLPDEHGLPTIREDMIRIPKDDPGAILPGKSEWLDYFKDGRLPSGLNRLRLTSASAAFKFGVADAAKKPVQVLTFAKPQGPPTKPQRSMGAVEILPSSVLQDLDPVGMEVAPVGPAMHGGGGGGLPPRPPPLPSGPPEPPPKFPPGPVDPKQLPDFMLNAARAIRDLNLNDPAQMNIWRRAGRVLVGPHLRGPLDLRTHLMMLKSAEGMAHIQDTMLRALKDAAPNAPRNSLNFQSDTVKVGKGLMTPDELAFKHPEVRAAKPLYDDLMREAKADEAWLFQEKMLNPREDTLAESPEYLTKMALTYMMKGKKALQFAKSLEGGQVWKDAIKGVIDDHQTRGQIIDEIRAEGYLRDLIGSDDAIATWNGAPGAGNAKARKNLPTWLSKVLGQDLAGELAMAHRLAVQKSAVARGTVFKEIAKRPDWVNAQRMDPSWKQMPASRWLYHDLSDMFVHPHIYDSIVPHKEWGTLAAKQHDISRQPNGIYHAFKRISGVIKGNEIANLTTIFNSFMGNWVHMAMAGVSPAEFPRYGMNMWKALRAATDYNANPLAQDGLAYFVRDARRVGFDAEGFGSADVYRGEVSDLQKTFLKAAQKAHVGSHPWAGLIDGFEAVIKQPGKFTHKVGAVLDMTDRMHKMAAGYTLAEQALRRARNGEKGFAGVINTREDAMRWAARRVNDAYPMPDRIGLYPKYMSDAAGAVNPYSTFLTESIRTHLSTPARIAEDPRIAVSMAAWGVVLAGVYKTYEAANPVDKKLIEEERKTRVQGGMTYEPATVPLAFTSSNGRPILADATPMFETMKYLNGEPTLSVVSRVTGNAALNLTDRGILGDAVQAGMERIDPRWEKHERKRRLWDTGAGAAVDWVLMDSGLVPKLPGKLYRQWASTQPIPLNPYSPMQQQPPEIAAMRAAGLPILPQVNPTARALMPKIQQGQMKSDLRGRLMEPEGYSRPGPFSGVGKDTGEDIQRIIEERTRQR